MTKEEVKKLFTLTINTWGVKSQILMTIEECSELIHALVKYDRRDGFGNKTNKSIIEEVADVEIMLEQIKHMFGIEESVEEIKDKKLKRLKGRLQQIINNE